MSATVESLHPLSPAQEGMLADSLAAGSGAYVEHLVCPLEGALDADAFAAAWERLAARHPVLRSAFVWKGLPEPRQFALSAGAPPLAREDWSALEDDEAEARLADRIAADRAAGFDPGRPPLLRAALLRRGPARSWLVWSYHHILVDGWSLPILLEDLLALYGAERGGPAPPPAPAATAFARHVAWLRARDAAPDEAYWRGRLRGFAEPTPVAARAPAEGAGEGAESAGEVDVQAQAEVLDGLRARARALRLPLNALVQAAWAAFLGRWSGRGDVVFGTTVSGRRADDEAGERAVGMYVATLPVRVALDPALPVDGWLGEVGRALLEAGEHAHAPPAAVRAAAEVPLALPLYDSLLVFENYPAEAGRLAGGGVRVVGDGVRLEGGRTRFAVTALVSAGDALRVRLIHDPARVRADDARRAADRFAALLAALADGSAETVGELLERVSAGGAAEPDPAGAARAAGAGGPPRTVAERLLAELWSATLGVQGVGRDDGFFALGGHSLLAARLAEGVRAAFGVDLPLDALFQAPTVAAMAERLSQASARAEEEPLPRIVPDPPSRHEPFPLTEVQRAYWIGRRGDLELGDIPSLAYLEVEAHGVDPAVLEEAVDVLVRRHDMLRAVFLPDGTQQVLPSVPRYPVRLDVLPEGEEQAGLERVRSAVCGEVADPGRWPLLGLRMTRSALGERLHIAYDPLICDASSFGLLARELSALLAEPDTELPPLPVTFREYVLAEREIAGTERHARSLEYWRGRLATLPPPPDLPLEREDAVEGPPRFRRVGTVVDAEAWARLKAHAAAHHLTASAVVLAAYAEVLAAWSRAPRFTLNLTLFNRHPLHDGVEGVVGDFTSLTLLEADAAPQGPFAERARRLQAQLWRDLDHRYVGGVQVMKELTRARAASAPVMMPVVFTSTLLNGPGAADEGAALGKVVHSFGQTPQVWLDDQAWEHEGALHLAWDALDGRFPPGMVEEMFAAYERLLRALAEGAAAWETEAFEFVPAHTLALRRALNDTATDDPREDVVTPVLAQARRTPDAVAVVAPARTLTYAQVARESARIAARLRARGAGRDVAVAVMAPRGWEQVVSLLAVLRAGALYVPIDPAWPAPRQRELLEASGAALAVVVDGAVPDPSATEGVARVVVGWADGMTVDGAAGMDGIDRVAGLDGVEGIDIGAEVGEREAWETAPEPRDMAYVIFTSGSTGRPKGVAMAHGPVANTLRDINRRFAVGPADRVLALSPSSFDLSVWDVFGTLAAGGTIVVPAAGEARDPGAWLRLVRERGITVWNSVPALMEMLVERAAAEGVDRLGLRVVMMSGDWIPVRLPGRIRALAPGVLVSGLGGATEAAIWSVSHPTVPEDEARPSIPYGRPLENQTLHVLDEAFRDRPDHVPGDLHIGGYGLAEGYWRNPEQTRRAFVSHPRTGERLYRTGDLARFLPDGTLEFLGRADGQVKIRGFRVELAEVEGALAHHPDVHAAVARAVGGRERLRLVGYVVPRPDAPPPSAADLRGWVAARLPEYMVPGEIVFMDSLPLGATGKVDRRALPDPEPAPAATQVQAALSEMEELVAGFFAQTLGLPSAMPTDHLFGLGGDSIGAARLGARLRAVLGVEVPMRVVFEQPTPRGIAGWITARGASAAAPPLVRRGGGGPVPAATAQERLWLLDRLHPADARQMLAGTLRLRGSLDDAALERALGMMAARHEPLRTTLALRDGRLMQEVHPPAPVPLARVAGPAELDPASLRTWVEAHLPPDYDPGRLPLWGCALGRRGDEDHVLAFHLHHAIADAWSMGVLARDLGACYAALAGGAEPELSPLPVQYGDYAAWERERLSAERVAELRTWWEARLDGAPDTRIPARPSPDAAPVAGSIPLVLPPPLAAALRGVARGSGATLFATLLAALAVVLRRATGQADLVVGTSVAGRERPELADLVGCFINLLPLRVDAGGDPPFGELVSRTGRGALEAFARQELPFEEIAAAARGARGGDAPAFRVMLVLQSAPGAEAELAGVAVESLPVELPRSLYELHVYFTPTAGGALVGGVRHDPAAVDAATARALAADFEAVVRAVAEDPALTTERLIQTLDAAAAAREDAARTTDQRMRLERLRALARPADAPEGASTP
jgi:amino acid adenylation domain-containing protein